MKLRNIFLPILVTAIVLTGCEKDFLDTPPQDELVDETYWTSEENVATFAYGFYPHFFTGYGSGYAWGKFFSGETLNDDFAGTNPPPFTRQIPTTATNTAWSFSWVRKANIMLDRIQTIENMDEDVMNHWMGVARFFRGMAYYDLVKEYGDVPWLDEEVSEEDTENLYKEREPREEVMANVLEDFEYAAQNVSQDVANPGLMVNRDVVLAFMSRIFLFEGTWQKYQENNLDWAITFLEASKSSADELISESNYSLGNYRDVFSSENLIDNPEVILYREYGEGELTHALMSYNNSGESQTGISKDAVESYLADDGLPITISSRYQGDHGIENVMGNRDGRLSQTVVPYELRINGIASAYSTSAYAIHKFLSEDLKNENVGFSNLNITDAPVIRYGEVLINYAEAAVELDDLGAENLSQDDLNRSINVLRSRPGVALPDLGFIGDMPVVNGQTYNDPERDEDVSSLIWEIRRERRVELMMEGFRNDDLRRWSKYEYIDMVENKDINRGAWIDKDDYEEELNNLEVTEGDHGYIIPSTADETLRTFDDPRVYLEPIPLDQITLYSDQGVELEQNPGW